MTGSSGPSRWVSSLRDWPFSARLFAALILGVLGLAYLAFLAQIGLETQMRIGLIAEAYRDMDVMEYAGHSFRYLSWFVATFAVAGGIFLFTGYSEKIKGFVAVWTPLLIVIDLAATWFIRYSDIFAYILFAAGFLLALTFAFIFFLVQSELWHKNPAKLPWR